MRQVERGRIRNQRGSCACGSNTAPNGKGAWCVAHTAGDGPISGHSDTAQQDRKRSAMPVGDQMTLRAGQATVDRRWARVAPPYSALTWEESTTQRDQSSRGAAFNSASRTSCSRCHTPVSFQFRSRRQHVMPESKPRSCGRLPLDPVCSTYNQDPAQRAPVRQRLATRIPEPVLTLRQQRLQLIPRFIRHDPRRRPHTGPNLNSRPERDNQEQSTSLRQASLRDTCSFLHTCALSKYADAVRGRVSRSGPARTPVEGGTHAGRGRTGH